MIKIAIVGAGMVAGNHAYGISQNEKCKLTMVADLDIEKAKKVAERYGAIACTDYHDFCIEGENRPDIVIVNLPNFLHCEVSIYFMSQGMDVLVEKPMARTVEECDMMIEASKKYGVKLGVAHVMQYEPISCYIKEVIENEKYGKLVRVVEERNCDYFTNRPSWAVDKKYSGGGMVINYFAHTLNKLLYITGSKVDTIHGVLSNFLNNHNVEEGAQILTGFENGVSLAVSYSGGLNLKAGLNTTYYFTNGVLRTNVGFLEVFQSGEWVRIDLPYETDIFCEQIDNLALWYEGHESKISTPEHGREVVEAATRVLSNKVYK